MPFLDGFDTSNEIVKAIKEFDGMLSMPRIIAVTAQEDLENHPKFPTSSLEKVIYKPVSVKNLSLLF